MENKKMQEEGCPYIVKNEHLFKALVFRKHKNYTAMYKELVIACQENDEEALIFVYELYGRHGFDGKRYPELVSILEEYDPKCYYETNNFYDLEELVRRKNIIASYALCFYDIDGMDAMSQIFAEHLNLCCKWNDCFALCVVPTSLLQFQSALDQGYEPGRGMLIQKYNIRREYVVAARLIVGGFDAQEIYMDIDCALRHNKTQRTRQAFIFGRWLSTRHESQRLIPYYAPCFHVYKETITKVKTALNCWLVICKRRIFPGYKDLIKLIGNLIWESREDTELWKIDLERKGPTRKAKKIKI
jgi:hypothetical protein